MIEYHKNGPFQGQIVLSKLNKKEHLEHLEYLMKTKYARRDSEKRGRNYE